MRYLLVYKSKNPILANDNARDFLMNDFTGPTFNKL